MACCFTRIKFSLKEKAMSLFILRIGNENGLVMVQYFHISLSIMLMTNNQFIIIAYLCWKDLEKMIRIIRCLQSLNIFFVPQKL